MAMLDVMLYTLAAYNNAVANDTPRHSATILQLTLILSVVVDSTTLCRSEHNSKDKK
jgi:hypothetical protein